jgi:hypothetical protein
MYLLFLNPYLIIGSPSLLSAVHSSMFSFICCNKQYKSKAGCTVQLYGKKIGLNLVRLVLRVSSTSLARLRDFNEATLLHGGEILYLQGISRPCHVSATCSFLTTVSTECTYCTVYNGVSYRQGLRAKVPDIPDSVYPTL